MTDEKAVPSADNLADKGSLIAETPPSAGDPLPPAPELDLEKRLKQVYADKLVTTTEFMALRDDADQLFEKLKTGFPHNGYLKLFQPLSDLVVETMQHAVLEIRKDKPGVDAKALVKQSLGFQVAYIKASLDRLTQSL